MTQNYEMVGGCAGAVIAMQLAAFLSVPLRGTPALAVIAVGFLGGAAVWAYSPLPNTSGGITSADPRGDGE